MTCAECEAISARLAASESLLDAYRRADIKLQDEVKVLRLRLEGALGALTLMAEDLENRAADVSADLLMRSAAVRATVVKWAEGEVPLKALQPPLYDPPRPSRTPPARRTTRTHDRLIDEDGATLATMPSVAHEVGS